ncbi:hypothetical protein ES707_10073 [subsurface metagenome]
MSESYYSCPHCKGKIKIRLTPDGRLMVLEHIKETKK